MNIVTLTFKVTKHIAAQIIPLMLLYFFSAVEYFQVVEDTAIDEPTVSNPQGNIALIKFNIPYLTTSNKS